MMWFGWCVNFGFIPAMCLGSNPQLKVPLSQFMHSYIMIPLVGNIKCINKNPMEAFPLGDVTSPFWKGQTLTH